MKNRELLEHPFEPDQIRQRKGTFGGMLDYVEGHAIIQRLNEAMDGDWSFEITTRDILEKSDEVVVIGKLQAGGVTKMQFGSSAITRNKDTGDMVSLANDFKAAKTPFACSLIKEGSFTPSVISEVKGQIIRKSGLMQFWEPFAPVDGRRRPAKD